MNALSNSSIGILAYLEWVNSFSEKSENINRLSQLSDGILLLKIMIKIFPEVSKDSNIIYQISSDDWMSKLNNLKLLTKYLIQYYEVVLKQEASQLELINILSIAKETQIENIVILLQLLLYCAMHCPMNLYFIEGIMKLSSQTQATLKIAIEDIRSASHTDHNQPARSVKPENEDNTLLFTNENTNLRKQLDHIRADYNNLNDKYDALYDENDKMKGKLALLEHRNVDTHAIHLKEERAKQNLEKLLSDIQYLEDEKRQTQDKIAEMDKKLTSLTKTNESQKMRIDELIILKEKADILAETESKLFRAESTNEKLKKRLEELTDLKQQLHVVEEQNSVLIASNSVLKERLKEYEANSKADVVIRRESIDADATVKEMERLNAEIHILNQQHLYDMELTQKYEEQLKEFSLQRPTAPENTIAFEDLQSNFRDMEMKIKKLEEERGRLLIVRDNFHALQTSSAENEKVLLDKEKRLNEMMQELALTKEKEKTRKQMEEEWDSKITTLVEKNQALHVAIQAAKEHIKKQDETIKKISSSAPSSSSTISTAMQTLDSLLQEKIKENDQLRQKFESTVQQYERERRVILAQWYNFGISVQKRGILEKNEENPTLKALGIASPSKRSPSWLERQRQNIRLD